MLDSRKELILKNIINEYIEKAEPVSSSHLLEKYKMNLSSATIRNEMNELEKLGYLEKQHTSSGRIPSNNGYRYYVEKLIINEKLNKEDLKSIKFNLEKKENKLEDVLLSTSATLSEITHYTTVAIGPDKKKDCIKSVEFMQLNDQMLMIVIVTKGGIIRESIIKFDLNITEDIVLELKKIFNKKLCGYPLEVINGTIENFLKSQVKININIISKVIAEINKILSKNELRIEGYTKAFNYPELDNKNIREEYINILNNDELMRNIISSSEDIELINDLGEKIDNIKIYIGKADSKILKNFTVITLDQEIGDKDLGKVAILAPKRMDYKKVVLAMNEIYKKLKDKNRR